MSDISKSLKSYLLSKSNLRQDVGDRIHFDFLPEPGKTPAVVIEEVSGDHQYKLTGAAGVYYVDVRVTVYSHHPTDRATIAEKIRTHLQGFRGTVGSDRVESCQLTTRDKRVIPSEQVGPRSQTRRQRDTHLYIVEMLFEFVVTETIPTF